MKRSRNGVQEMAGLVELVLIGGVAYLAYQILAPLLQSSVALKNLLAPSTSAAPSTASSIADFLTGRPTIDLSSVPASAFQAGATTVRPSGTLVVVDATGRPQTYGPDGIIPGAGVSVNDLRAQGVSDQQIGQMIVNSQTNPGVGGGAGGSW